jgi:hypothetical protein
MSITRWGSLDRLEIATCGVPCYPILIWRCSVIIDKLPAMWCANLLSITQRKDDP